MTNIQDPVSGVAQVVKNAGDIAYRGFELDSVYTLTNTVTMVA